MRVYSPGQVSELTGFSRDTLRYYERIGLMPDVDRTAGGQRRYSEMDLLWLHMLRCLRDTGMPISEMLRYTELSRGDQDRIPECLALLEAHDRRIEEQIAHLRDRQEQVRRKVDAYQSITRSRLPIVARVSGAPTGTAPTTGASRGARPA